MPSPYDNAPLDTANTAAEGTAPALAGVHSSWPDKLRNALNLKKPALDTITTRFLMLFIFLLAVPIVSVTVFTFSLLSQEVSEQGKQNIQIISEAFLSQESHLKDLTHTLATGGNCHNLLLAPAVHCIKLPETIVRPQYQWHNGALWYVEPMPQTPYNAIGFALGKRFLHRFYQEQPSSHGEIALIPLNASQQSKAVLTTGLATANATSWLNVDWLSQQRSISPIIVKLEQGNYWLLQHFIYDDNHHKMASVVFFTPSVLQIKIDNYYVALYLLMVISIVLAVVLAMIAGRPITQPLLKLIEQMNALHHGNLHTNHTVNVHGVHEINQLAASFNNLLQRLRHAHTLRDEFVATLTHDLKVPLLAEKQTLRYLIKGTYDPITDNQREVLEVMGRTNAESLLLVNGLLEVYRYESGTVRLSMDTLDLRQLLQETIHQLNPLAQEKQISLALESHIGADETVSAYGDTLELKRVLHNLISNAITNTAHRGSIVCKVETGESLKRSLLNKVSPFQYTTLRNPVILKGRVLISVQDSGIGFEAEDLPRLFQQFSASRGRNPMSTGLGLFNCHQVVEAHHGVLWVETTEGEGAAVSFVIPQNSTIYQDRRRIERRGPVTPDDSPSKRKPPNA